MNPVIVLELVFTALLILFTITQAIVPFIKGNSLFPFFRDTRKLESELIEAEQELINAKTKQEILEKQKKAEEFSRQNKAGENLDRKENP